MRFRSQFFLRQVQFLKAEAMGVVLAVSFFGKQCEAHPAIARKWQWPTAGGIKQCLQRRTGAINSQRLLRVNMQQNIEVTHTARQRRHITAPKGIMKHGRSNPCLGRLVAHRARRRGTWVGEAVWAGLKNSLSPARPGELDSQCSRDSRALLARAEARCIELRRWRHGTGSKSRRGRGGLVP